jgi:protein SCO1/2
MKPIIAVTSLALAGLLGFSLGAGAAAEEAAPSAAPTADDPHALHRAMAANPADASDSSDTVRRSEAQYSIPNVTLTRDDGKTVTLPAELDDGRPVVLNFIYTSCTTICPLSSQIFEQFQEDLGAARGQVHLVSISIDPEQDTPARLREYAAQYHAARGWNHYSGALSSTIAVQKAFNAYRGDKMSHSPLTLMRAAPGKPWVRFDGFARAAELMAERKSWESAASLVAR